MTHGGRWRRVAVHGTLAAVDHLQGRTAAGRIPGMSALVLAGGRNTRMGGRDKCRLIIRGRPLFEQVLELLDGLFAEVIMVAARQGDYGELPGGARAVEDRYRGCGPLGGLQAGLQACTKGAAFCVACDMPYLDPGLIRRQAALYQALQADDPPAEVLLPRTGSLIEPLHGIYSRRLEPTIRALLEDGRGYSIRRLFALVRTCYLDLPESPEIRRSFFNVNTPEDVSRTGSEAQP